jgi:hypothetical protein
VYVRKLIINSAMGLSFVLLATMAVADTLTFRDGTRITGTIVSIAERMITFRDQRGVSHRYDANQVDSITFTPSAGRNAEMPPARRFETVGGSMYDLMTRNRQPDKS